MNQSTKYIVEPGDCISKIAVEHGYTWKQIWNDSANKKLKKLRKDPNVLMPGDEVVIPAKKKKDKKKGTGAKHNFKRNKEMSKIKLQLLVDGKPIQNMTCRLEVEGSPDRMGRVDGEGIVAIEGETEFNLSSTVTFARLYVGDEPKVTIYDLDIGYLNPIEEVSGIQQRLNNLGFESGANDGYLGPVTEDAIRRYQKKHKLKETGEADKKFKTSLEKTHGT
ncbi:MAG: peptidoglycan-binding protein [Mariniblastus sp.]